MNAKAVDALRASRAAASQDKRAAVEQALADAVTSRVPVTVAGIASRAKVSRTFIYAHPDLQEAIAAAARAQRESPKKRLPLSGAVEQGLRADQATLAKKVKRQRETIAELNARILALEDARKRRLSKDLDAQQAVSPEAHAELILTVTRLMDDKQELQDTVAELRRLNSIAQDRLAASREAHAAAVAALSDSSDATVRTLTRRGD